MVYDPILAVGLVMVAGLIGGSAASAVRLPRITGYIVAGMLLSPSITNLMTKSAVANLSPFITVTLAIIGYAIGGSLHLNLMRAEWRSIFWIALLQGVLGWGVSTVGIFLAAPRLIALPNAGLWTTYFPIAFVLGAISWATAPAVTIAIIHECRAKGSPVVAMLSIVALTDIMAVISLAMALNISASWVDGRMPLSLYPSFILPVGRLLGAAALGLGAGVLLNFAGRGVRDKGLLVVSVFGIIICATGISESLAFPSVLTSMVAGFITVNWTGREEMFLGVEGIENLIFVLFFVISGMIFDFGSIVAAGILSVVVELTRCAGKWLGSFLGAKVAEAPAVVRKYIGLPLLPKAGLTIGLAFIARNELPQIGEILFNVLLASTLLNMLFTPPLAK